MNVQFFVFMVVVRVGGCGRGRWCSRDGTMARGRVCGRRLCGVGGSASPDEWIRLAHGGGKGHRVKGVYRQHTPVSWEAKTKGSKLRD